MRILIADDDAVMLAYLDRLVRRLGFETVLAPDGSAALSALVADDPPRIAILDWMMPGYSGAQIVSALRADADRPYTYALLVTGHTSGGSKLDALEAGVDDFLSKPFDPSELTARLRVAERITSLYQRLEDRERELAHQAGHDALTGLMNRGSIFRRLEAELRRAAHGGLPPAVLAVDLDHFKVVNDTFGHAAGDAVLREAALRLRSAMRELDAVGRIGGEEFVAVLPSCPRDAALAVAERMCQRVRATPMLTGDGQHAVTCSVGVVVARAAEAAEDVVRRADAEMYRAKAEGRDRVVGEA